MGLLDLGKEVKDEIKSLVAASIETAKEIARLQERVMRAEQDYKETLNRYDGLFASQTELIQQLRDRVAKLEAQQHALHNDAQVIAATLPRRNDKIGGVAGLLTNTSDGDYEIES